MILVLDNASYPHKHNIVSHVSLSKKELVTLMEKYNVETVDLPVNSENRLELINAGVCEDRGDAIKVGLNFEEQLQRASSGRPTVGIVEELKISSVTYLQMNNPRALDCRVEKFLHSKGHIMLWIPPYFPDLQPIEMFWGNGKNHVSF